MAYDTREMGSKLRTYAARLLGFVLVLACTLLLLELLLRVAHLEPPGTFSNIRYENDPQTGLWALPSQVGFHRGPCFTSRNIHFNSFGMRDAERTLAASGRTRIAFVGDSYTQGLQVGDAETVSRQLEALGQGRAEVLNFGVASVGTSVELLIYRHRVRPFHPRAVVLLFFVGNDVEDNLPELKRTKDPQMGDITPYLLLDAKGNLEDAPRLGAYRRTGRLTATLAFFSFGRWMDQAYTRWKRSRPSKKPASPALAGKGGGSLYEQAWAITEKVLERFQKEVASDGAWFGIAVIPSDMGALAKTGRLTSEAAARIDRLQSTAARLSIPLLDLSQTFVSLVRQQGPQRLSFDCDDHWNARGHAEAAPALLQLLRTAGVL